MPALETVVSKSIIKKRETLSHSIMPRLGLDNLSMKERRDLIAYLMNPNPDRKVRTARFYDTVLNGLGKVQILKG